jgi:hypothetical protein
MYGNDMGTLRLEISTNGGLTWSTRWSKSGPQGGSWNGTSLHLLGYSNSSNVRFRFVGEVGSSYTSDLAIDAFKITTLSVVGSNVASNAPAANSTTALPELQTAPTLTVAPNPFQQRLQLTTNLQGNVFYQVANLQGQTLQQGALNSQQLELPNLVPGVYFLTVYNEQERLTRKVVRQ